MAQQWEDICKLPGEDIIAIQSFYSRFPFIFEIRVRFAKWIESIEWSQLDENNPRDSSDYANPLLKELLDKMKYAVRMEPSLEGNMREIQERYSTAPLAFIKDMKECLALEEKLMRKNKTKTAEEKSSASTMYVNDDGSLDKILDESKKLGDLCSVFASDLEEMRKKQEEFEIHMRDLSIISVNFKERESEIQEQTLHLRKVIEGQTKSPDQIMEDSKKIEDDRKCLEHEKNFVNTHLKNCINELKHLLSRLTLVGSCFLQEFAAVEAHLLDTDIPEWKYNQRLACNGGPQPTSLLRVIRKRTDVLCIAIAQYKQLLTKFEEVEGKLTQAIRSPEVQSFLGKVKAHIALSERRILESTFLVDQQPPQVLRKDIRFETSALLIAGKLLNTSSGSPRVRAHLISEFEARSINGRGFQGNRHLVNDRAVFESLPDGTLSAKLRPTIDRSFKRDTKQRVANGKYYLLFECCISDSDESSLKVLSVPVMVTSNISQECECLGRIIWDHQFADKNDVVPESVLWPKVADLLNARFLHDTGRGLNESQMRYIGLKLLGNATSDPMVTFEKFCKVKEGSFTFWDWIHHIIKLIKDHLKGLWTDRTLDGFVSRQEIDQWLLHEDIQRGNVMVRFSETVLGGISIVERRKSRTDHMEPLTAKDFQTKSPFPLLVRDTKRWKYWYPNQPIDEVLGKYYNESQQSSDDSDPNKRYKKFVWTLKSEDCDEEDATELTDMDTGVILQEFLSDADLREFVNYQDSDMMNIDN